MDKIKCHTINYRQGYIEVRAGIHDECINIETWEIDAAINLKERDINDHLFPESGIVANTEIELSIDNAKALIKQLEKAIQQLNSN